MALAADMTAVPQAIVIGGSLGGLFAGEILRSIGWRVEIYERSTHELDSRGGGLVLQPQVLQVLRRAQVPYDTSIGVLARERIYVDREGRIVQRQHMPQTQTSWTSLYAAMRRHFPSSHYHQGAQLASFEQDAAGVRAQLADGRSAHGDLLIAADGGGSTVRQALLPEVEPSYAGYVAWRGLVEERDLPSAAAQVLVERFSFFNYPNAHILCYMVPGAGESIAPGERRYNWVWYRNVEAAKLPALLTDREGGVRASSVPPGMLPDSGREAVYAAADRFLPPQFRSLVQATAEPFIQAIVDLKVPQMAFGRVALLGDAAFQPRPHTAASTSKAAGNALALADALRGNAYVLQALKKWEPEQLEYGEYLYRRGVELGRRSQSAYPGSTPT